MFCKRSSRKEAPRCSFCHKGEDAAGELIASPSNDDPLTPFCYICADCVAVCNSILDDRRSNRDQGPVRSAYEWRTVLDADPLRAVRDKVTTVRSP
jgi:hypothetical protein